MVTYKITLTPLEKFFFGGENVFGQAGAQDDRRRSYLVRSNLLPQQTTLLGMLRQQLLAQNNLLLNSQSGADQETNAIALVGAQSFSPHNTTGYGLIKAISPVLLEDEQGQSWQPAGLDDRKNTITSDWLEIEKDEQANRYFLRHFDPKQEMNLQFVNAGGERKDLDQFFSAFSQVGIKITNRLKQRELALTEDDKKEGLFRQTFRSGSPSVYAGHPGYSSFVFYAQFDDAIAGYQFSGNKVQMGGERATFNMKAERLDNMDDLQACLQEVQYGNHQAPGDLSRIVLLSDTYVNWQAIRPHVVLSVTQSTPFRYFTSILGKTARFYDLNNKEATAISQSGLFQLLSRGSVLYAKTGNDTQTIKTFLESQQAFQLIGYNFFKIN